MRFIPILCMILLFSGCEDEIKPKKPSNLIAEEEMVDILYEVYILHAAKGLNKKLLELNGVNPETYIFEKYKIDSLQFAQSNNYYSYWPERYQSIIDSVKSRVVRLKDVYEDERDAEELEKKRRRDSVNAIIKKGRDSILVPERRIPRLKDSIR